MPDLDRSAVNVVTLRLEEGDTFVTVEPPRPMEGRDGPFVMPWTVSVNRGLLVLTSASRVPLERLHAALGAALAAHSSDEPAAVPGG